MSTGLWPTIRGLCDWLDRENGRGDHEMAMRFLKIAEEAGEAAAAYIGWRGQNPRKGVSHTRADVEAELCDVIVTAAVSLATISDDPEAVFAAKLEKIAARAGVVGKCSAGLLPLGNAPVERCVTQGRHDIHTTANGQTWTNVHAEVQ
ncbi:MazG-like family protein [Streptomyces sp. NPDC059994]|uniref:MazG-like family protein n=1 Tax=Streptomyces sp. NPDC059994 TaxID=3347029 RepID=UPI0036A509C6